MIFAILLLGLGCDDAGRSAKPPTTRPAAEVKPEAATTLEQTEPATAEDLKAAIAANGSITFLSDDGRWGGHDMDRDFTFLAGGDLHHFSYGVAMQGFRGRYEVSPNGEATLSLPSTRHQWPTMVLRRDGGDLLLFEKAQDEQSWPPYRQIPPADEAQQRNEIEARGATTTQPGPAW